MLDDLRLAWRRLRSAPGFALAAVLTLALAVGANTAIFSVADAVLFRPLPYAEPDRLFLVRRLDRSTGTRYTDVPFVLIEALQQHHSGIAGVALRSPTIMSVQPGPDGAEFVERLSADPDYFRVLGVRPVLGRVFEPDDTGSAAAILTHESWKTRFGGDRGIVGREIELGGDPYVIVGVLPPKFIFPSESQLYGADTTGRSEWVNVGRPREPGSTPPVSNAVVRLEAGVTREQAQAELDALSRSLLPAPGQAQTAATQFVLDDIRSVLFPSGRTVLWLLLIAAGLVLLIGCANLANMLLARIQRRERELAVHAALGATPVRLMRPVLFETMLIGAAAALLALVVTMLTFDALHRQVPPVAYGRAFIGVDLRVALFTITLGLLSGAVFAAVPAWRSVRAGAASALAGYRHAVRNRRMLGRPMVTVQVAMSIVLVVSAISATRRFLDVINEPLGFNADKLIAITVFPGGLDEGPEVRRFYEDAVAAVQAHPDVVSAAAGRSRPFDRFRPNEFAVVADQQVPTVHVLPGYLDTLGVRVRQGRLPHRADIGSDLEVAVVSLSAAKLLAAGAEGTSTITFTDGRSARVVGVIDDVIRNAGAGGPSVYLVPRTLDRSTVIARTRTATARTLAEIRRAVVAMTPQGDPVRAAWVSDAIDAQSRRDPRFQALLLGSFAGLGLGLATLGVFAVVAAMVALRTREWGVRLAIGASPRRLVRDVMSGALVPVAVGIFTGAALTFALDRFVQSQLSVSETLSPDALAIASVTMLAAAAAAAYWPARRTTRVDPVTVLRAE